MGSNFLLFDLWTPELIIFGLNIKLCFLLGVVFSGPDPEIYAQTSSSLKSCEEHLNCYRLLILQHVGELRSLVGVE